LAPVAQVELAALLMVHKEKIQLLVHLLPQSAVVTVTEILQVAVTAAQVVAVALHKPVELQHLVKDKPVAQVDHIALTFIMELVAVVVKPQ
jgi:hypothetical protein